MKMFSTRTAFLSLFALTVMASQSFAYSNYQQNGYNGYNSGPSNYGGTSILGSLLGLGPSSGQGYGYNRYNNYSQSRYHSRRHRCHRDRDYDRDDRY